jgi:kynureninase
MNHDPYSLTYAQALDQRDPLARFRDEFVFADPDLIYLDGNSLGRLPKATVELLRDGVEHQWGERLIRGWNEGWMELNGRIGAKIGRLIGAQASEVIVADATSTNLYKLATAAIAARPGRSKIVTDDLNFPSDLYILQGICARATPPLRLEVVPSPDGVHGPVDALLEAIDEETALVALTHTVFKSAYVYDMARITDRAHAAGALALWDLSHAAGSVLVDLNGANADLAVGCTYKYLNGGPGSPAFLYVREDLQAELANPIQGWMGQADMFDFGLDYSPAPGIQHFLTGTPPVLSVSAIEPGVDLLLAAGMEALRAKSVAQSDYLIDLWETKLAPWGFSLKSPQYIERRGSHVSLGHPDGWRIAQALINDQGVLPDFRQPDNIRLGIAPLYTSFAEIFTAVARLEAVMTERLYERYSPAMRAVT